jgi:hypothetical protein
MIKQTLAVITLIASTFTLQAQNNNVVSAINYLNSYLKEKDPADLNKAKQRIDSAAKHTDTKDKAKTWHYRGKIYHAYFDKELSEILAKITETDMQKKNSIAFQTVNTDPLETALESYKQSIDLDTKKDWESDNKKLLANCLTNLDYKIIALYNGKKWDDATIFGEKNFELTKKYSTKIDTQSLDIAAYSAIKIKNYDRGISLYNKLLDIKYQPVKTHSYIIEANKSKGDYEGTKAAIKNAVSAFPNEYTFLLEQLNIDLKEGKSEEAVNNLKTAISKTPINQELHLVLGQTYSKMAFPMDKDGKEMPKPSNFDELIKNAENEFNKSIELKPDYALALYSFGIMYNNLGAEVLKNSQNLKDTKSIQQEEEKAKNIFLKAIPLLEKALELDKTDKFTMKALKQLYAKTGQADSEKYKKVSEMLKN